MCGITGFVSSEDWRERGDTAWVTALHTAVEQLGLPSADPQGPVDRFLDALMSRFDDLMSFGFHYELLDQPSIRTELEAIVSGLERLGAWLEERLDDGTDASWYEQSLERVRDSHWQIRWEVLENLSRLEQVLSDLTSGTTRDRARHFVAWSLAQILENIDRLEVRGRDSAGVTLLCFVDESVALSPRLEAELAERGDVSPSLANRVEHGAAEGGGAWYGFSYKVANIIGRLGDNTNHIRQLIAADELLWCIAERTRRVNIVAHTRWASNGIISVPNCHPVDAWLSKEAGERDDPDRSCRMVLNGDVDNCSDLTADIASGGYQVDASITTDAKVPPLLYRFMSDRSWSAENRFAWVMNQCEGSMALIMQHPAHPDALFLGQKGSGQGLFASSVRDGWIVASEIYGLAARARTTYPLAGTARGGVQFSVRAAGTGASEEAATYLDDGSEFTIRPRPIDIYSRDIFRGDYTHYLEKELAEAPRSIRNTIQGKYRRKGSSVEFSVQGANSFESLVARLRDRSRPPIDEVLCIGQGTASIAGMGTAHLISKAVESAGIQSSWAKASEVSGFISDRPLDRMLLVAVSQSGTTTDTNRTVDLAAARGAWVHAIVNRRDSPLITRSNSHTYTSDGRDVEMSVASTKAFYSQVAAGKVLALLLANELHTLGNRELLHEISALEALPDKVEQILARREEIAVCARKYGPVQKNWAVVGNGPNRIAAEEIRIKVSELCYKSIPCDYTEDKKHIDLSTEPLTLVVANDLPELAVQDTAKEVAIFSAHGGSPIVICSRGEDRFDEYANQVIETPSIGGDLGFVLATVVGHLWGYYAALAIDQQADSMRDLRFFLTQQLRAPKDSDWEGVRQRFDRVLGEIAEGKGNAALPASLVAKLARYRVELAAPSDPEARIREGIEVLTPAIEEMTRPIDSIRHQAKTVTVGISRPQDALAIPLKAMLEAFSIEPEQLRARDLQELMVVSPLIDAVSGAMLYEVVQPRTVGSPGTPWLVASCSYGASAREDSRYTEPLPAGGTKRTALRLQHVIWHGGSSGRESIVLVPVPGVPEAVAERLVLAHIDFVPKAPPPQKLDILKRLGSRHDEILEGLMETSTSARLETTVERVTPRDLVIASIAELADYTND